MNIDDFKKKIFEDIIRIEKLPEVDDDSIVDIKCCSYPLSRGMKSYYKKLPNLEKNLKTNMNLLDIGAGNCIAISEIATTYQNGNYFATGIQNLQNCPSNISFEVAVACSLPFEDNYFDIVISVHGLSWELEQQKSIEEIYRILKPNGKAFLYFTPFEYSVDHKLGESYWELNGLNRNICKDYAIDINRLKEKMKIVLNSMSMKHSYKTYNTVYYVEIEK